MSLLNSTQTKRLRHRWKRLARAVSLLARQRARPLRSRNWPGFPREIAQDALELILPTVCAFCHRRRPPGSHRLCVECRARLIGRELRCPICGQSVPESIAWLAKCPGCSLTSPRYDRTFTLGAYRGELRAAVLQLKKIGQEALSRSLAEELAAQIRQQAPGLNIDKIVPIPTFWLRGLIRGINSPDLLAETISRELGAPLARRLLSCRRKTRKQSTLPLSERRLNVQGAYRVSTGYAIKGDHVLVVDDVMTSGSTATEVAKTLRSAGAAAVYLAVVARGNASEID